MIHFNHPSIFVSSSIQLAPVPFRFHPDSLELAGDYAVSVSRTRGVQPPLLFRNSPPESGQERLSLTNHIPKRFVQYDLSDPPESTPSNTKMA
jgi:hypothetical protein